MGLPHIFPTGTTIYKKSKCYNGYTLFPSTRGALLIDMMGNEVHLWSGLAGFPNKFLPGGQVIGSTGARDGNFGYQDQLDLVQVDWDGHIVWKFDHNEEIEDPGTEKRWMARQHHDFQREGSPVGYYAPGQEPYTDHGNTLILTHTNVSKPEITDKVLIDDRIIEVTWEGEIVWDWKASDHLEEFGFDEAARNTLYRSPNVRTGGGDWLHINSMSELGPNHWYDEGDERFNPRNIIIDSRNANILAIISRETGKLVWRIGPDFSASKELRELGWIIGQHHLHMIPKGLPGEGNLLVFDNGGMGGYGTPNPGSSDGVNNGRRDYSRVLEFDPVTLEIKWQFTPKEYGAILFTDASKFYSSYISSAQRLPNGNTLITEGSDGRLLEVTPEHDVVWEYINPYFSHIVGRFPTNMVYRAYRIPYEWAPRAEHRPEKSMEYIDISTFRIPGSPVGSETTDAVTVDGVDPNRTLVTGSGASKKGEDQTINFCTVSLKASELKS
ncbi:MAG: aryl-sulfate sulfotransferase [Eubacterium sp.]|nr:aryl-sulfate sulfotransferase [Eubacterium sp.]